MSASDQQSARVIDILSAAYDGNATLQETVWPGVGWRGRIRRLIGYCYAMCGRAGKVYLSADGQAAALVLFPDERKFTLAGLGWDVRLLVTVTGVRRALKALARERLLRRVHPAEPIYHLYYIGTDPAVAGKGSGGALMRLLIADSIRLGRPMYVEARVRATCEWYQRFGFTVYHELEHAGRTWYCLRRDLQAIPLEGQLSEQPVIY